MSEPITPLASALAGRYAIDREIGSGGMAIVYAATDVRHRRRVAIKVLRPAIAAVLGAERFLHEIETSANLRHPNIVPLFDSGEADGFLYYVMPLIEGETLRASMDRVGPLPVEDALAVAREVADALNYAHGRGIVHRDVKPENVLLEAGHAVVTDFGIARAVGGARTEALTSAGIALGTPQYMSPEQATGDPVDSRSDLYSLACMTYEMLAGQPPFTGATVERVYMQHLIETPPPLARFRPAVPASVAAALRRALAKAPADRFPTTVAFADALSSTAESANPRSVAVLPFLNLSTDPENEYFADGITEDVIAQLSKIRSLKVVSRTSVMPFKKRDQGLREIAAQLQVATLLDGSVRRAGSRVRIVAQLLDAASDEHLWAETFDRELTDIFAIQSEVALHIAEALEAELSVDERTRIGRQPTRDPRAYQLLLQGRHHMIRYTREGLRQAIEYFEDALRIDAGFAPAWSALAMAYTELAEQGVMNPDEAFPRARDAAAKALELDPELPEAHITAAYGKLVYEFDWAGAEREFLRALDLSPGSADAYDLYGRLCSALGRMDEAIHLLHRAQELDPLAHRNDIATAYLRAGRYREALEYAERSVAFEETDARALSTLGWTLLRLGRTDEGLARLERAVALTPGNTAWRAQLAQAYGLYGDPAKAKAILDELVEAARTRYVAPYHLAYVYTGVGEHEAAIDCLERAFEQRAGAIYGVKGSFLFEPLRQHPRFKALLQRMGHPA